MSEPKTINVRLDPSAVRAPLNSILQQSTQNVLLALQMIDDRTEPFEQNRSSKSTFFAMEFGPHDPGFETTRSRFREWVAEKGCEDLIKGVNLTLGMASVYVSLLRNSGNLKTFKDLNELYATESKKAEKMHLPELIEKLEVLIGDGLEYKEEIRSINTLRKCLVHRHGQVTETDLTDKNTKELRFKYLKPRLIFQNDGEWIEIVAPTLLPENTGVSMDAKKTSKAFKLGETVKLSYEEFKSGAFTCHFFWNKAC